MEAVKIETGWRWACMCLKTPGVSQSAVPWHVLSLYLPPYPSKIRLFLNTCVVNSSIQVGTLLACVYPVPQNAPCVSPDPKKNSKDRAAEASPFDHPLYI